MAAVPSSRTATVQLPTDHVPDRDAHSSYQEDGLQEALDLLEQTAMSLRGGQSPGDRDHSAGPGRGGL
jgi:hypothetical protein